MGTFWITFAFLVAANMPQSFARYYTRSSPRPTVPSANPATACKNTFCTMAPTESSYLSGPGFPGPIQTYLLYSGNCVLEYQENYANGKLRVTRAPIPIATYFGQPAFTGPVTLAYTTLSTDGLENIKLNLVNANMARLTCATNNQVSTGGVNCTTPAVAGAGTVPFSKATSASSQYNYEPATMDSVMNIVHYAILPGDKELALYKTDFSTLYQQTSGFLTTGTPNGSSITKITAIQLMQDTNGDIPAETANELLAVYGTDANGAAYVGYVNATQLGPRLRRIPNQSLTDPPPYKWQSAPVPLAAQFENLLTCP